MSSEREKELAKALDPFFRLKKVLDALPPAHRADDNEPFAAVMPCGWSMMEELRKLHEAATGIKQP